MEMGLALGRVRGGWYIGYSMIRKHRAYFDWTRGRKEKGMKRNKMICMFLNWYLVRVVHPRSEEAAGWTVQAHY